MIGLTRMRGAVVLIVLSVSVMVFGSRLQANKPAGKFIQIEGQVSVNGTSAISGATVFSDSTITTAPRSMLL